jgi:RNA polymerase sigma-70 factor (ECF subfamily)
MGVPIIGFEGTTADDSATQPLEQFYSEHSNVVFKHLVLIGLDAQAAEDVLQETFLRLLNELRKGKQLQAPRWWLLKVATNLGLNHLRDSKSRGEFGGLPAAEILDRVIARGATAEQRLLVTERARALAVAMDQLSPQQKVCIHLRAEGMRYREIAEVLGVSISTVEEFLARAIARLRMKLT